MSSFLEVQNRINSDYLNRTTLVAETKRAIQAAVRHYENQRWPFNQTATALATVASVGSIALPANLLVLDDLRITINGDDLYLEPRPAQYIRNANTAPTYGQPVEYAIYQNKINTFPIANSAYALPIYYMKSLSTLSADTDTNAWIAGAMEDVIVYHATKLMWSNVLRNTNEALKYAALEKDALSTVNSQREQFSLNRLTPTRF